MTASGWPAPAKLNLLLRITGRRPDGYHTLQTVFQFLDFGDELRFRLSDAPEIVRRTPVEYVPLESDLVVRAARMLRAATGATPGVEIEVTKRIPMGGGLGGGSSDAATTLVALNHLWGTGLSVDSLAGLGVKLGADVPVFVHGLAAWGEGVGECLTPVSLPEPWYLVVTPECPVSTAEVFADPQLTRDSTPIKIADFLSGEGGNDCLPVVRRRFPPVAKALDWLGHFGEARLTGTGSSVFAAFDRKEAAAEAYRSLPSGWQGIVARGLNRSPLLERLRESQM